MYYEKIDLDSLVVIRKEDLCMNRLKNVFETTEIIASAGTVFVVDDALRLEGIITVSDYKKMLKDSKIAFNSKCKKITNEDNILMNVFEIEEQFKNIMILPIVDAETNILLGGVRTKSETELLFSNVLRPVKFFIEQRTELLQALFKERHWEKIRIHGTNYDVMCLIGALFIANGLVDTVTYSPYGQVQQCMFFKRLGEESIDCSIESDLNQLELMAEYSMVDRTKISVSDLKMMLDKLNMENSLVSVSKSLKKEWFEIPDKKELEEKYGIHILFAGIPDMEDMNSVVETKGYKPIHQYKDFFDSLDDDLYEANINIHVAYKNGLWVSTYDGEMEKLTLVDGKRFVPNENKNATNTIYLIGPCVVEGDSADDYNTIGYFLQNDLLKENIPYRVVLRSAVIFWGNYKKWLGRIPVKAGDCVVFINSKRFQPIVDIDMTEAFQKLYQKNGQFFSDEPIHCNQYGYRCIADEIFLYLQKNMLLKASMGMGCERVKYIKEYRSGNHDTVFAGNLKLEQFKVQLEQWKEKVEGRVGAIVMNCNPFTLGHQYLIETAAKQVDFLYILVVQEDKSQFRFSDRIEMVRLGTEGLSNVKVLAGGEFVISLATFSEYFIKGKLEEKQIDASLDVETFAQHIAPILDVSVRFVGEEPFDNVTRQYNESMMEILPDYGIEVVVIPRKEVDGEIVSASAVRKYLDSNQPEMAMRLVPASTWKYLGDL